MWWVSHDACGSNIQPTKHKNGNFNSCNDHASSGSRNPKQLNYSGSEYPQTNFLFFMEQLAEQFH